MTSSRRRIGFSLPGAIAFIAITAFGYAQDVPTQNVQDLERSTAPDTGLTVVHGSIELPLSTKWVALPDPSESLRQPSVLIGDSIQEKTQGQRSARLQRRDLLEKNTRALRNVYRSLSQYAWNNKGISPAKVEDLEAAKLNFLKDHGNLDKTHIIPSVAIYRNPGEGVRREMAPTSPFLIETHPALDDGKHWIMTSDGQLNRVPFDPELLDAHDITLVPGPKPRDLSRPPPETATYKVRAILLDDETTQVTTTVRNLASGEQQRIAWPLDTANKTDRNDALRMGKGAAKHWTDQARELERVLANYWAAALARQYDTSPNVPPPDRRRQARTTSPMALLGGRAAIRETLQLQALAPEASDDDLPKFTRISDIKGVEIKAHPFEEMLGDQPGGKLDLAHLAPIDRFFIQCENPRMFEAFLDKAAPFLGTAGFNFTGNAIDYNIAGKTFERFGLKEDMVRELLRGGAFSSMAVLLPDLFFIDGTDITVLARIANPTIAKFALAALGVSGKEPTVKKNTHGRPVYWQQMDDVLVISTHKQELDHVLATANTPKSLGASHEFRYMLTQLPVSDDTLMLAYFSDPFIRRLVGPSVKIAQLRRLKAKTEMEAVAAGQWLYQHDHGHAPTSLGELYNHEYAPRPRQATDLRLDTTDPNAIPISKRFGPLPRMRTLNELDIKRVAPSERNAYKTYLENYNRYWRRFFDPIAIRFDKHDDTDFTLETFILPLIDNSLYNQLGDMVERAESGVPLSVPVLDPAPVATLSFNLADDAWIDLVEDVLDSFANMIGWEASVFDDLGPDLHIAISDADPILGIGSGELGSLFGAVDGNEMFGIGIILSTLTRPVTFVARLQNEKRMLELLQTAPSSFNLANGFLDFDSTFYRLGDQNRWILELSLEGAVKVRFGLDVQAGFLLVSNLPLSQRPRITGERAAPLNGVQLTLQPGASLLERASLFTSAMASQRRAASAGMTTLSMLSTLGKSPEEAADALRHTFGFTPVHPPGGEFILKDGRVESTVFGNLRSQRQPDPSQASESTFGILRAIESLRVSTQFEQDGLRAKVHWNLRAPATPVPSTDPSATPE